MLEFFLILSIITLLVLYILIVREMKKSKINDKNRKP